jgi:hypothetical protein
MRKLFISLKKSFSTGFKKVSGFVKKYRDWIILATIIVAIIVMIVVGALYTYHIIKI